MAMRTPPSWLQNGSHPAENDRLSMQALLSTTGIVGASSLAVTAQGTPNMTVNVAAGWAAIVGTTQANMGTYVAYNDATTVLTVTSASTTNPRIDLVCMTVNDAYYSGSTNNVVLQIIAGTPAASPVAPTLPANSISLATIAVAANATVINSGNITDTRVAANTNLPVLTAAGSATLTNKTYDTAGAGNVFRINGTQVSAVTGSGAAVLGTGATLSTPLMYTPTIASGTIEPMQVTGSAFSGGWTLAPSSAGTSVTWANANAGGTGSVNLTWVSGGTTLNSYLAVNQSMTMTFIVQNGATAYYINSVQVDGTTTGVTTRWQGGTAPTAGNANAQDVYTFVVVKTAASTFSVFASQTKFA